ncbi:HD-GYP domain protein [Lachnospira eligens]|nr:HD-GYP domain protein [Lachnospira eligens]RHK88908.1 HD-GYP domain protein [Lachnospira eligens]
MKNHTVWGGQILSGLEFLPQADMGAVYHHERYDGKGYPYGIKGEELPWMVRIISAADSLDAMNSNRCYRKHCDKDYIIGEFEKGAGTQFDKSVAETVITLIEEGRIVI